MNAGAREKRVANSEKREMLASESFLCKMVIRAALRCNFRLDLHRTRLEINGSVKTAKIVIRAFQRTQHTQQTITAI